MDTDRNRGNDTEHKHKKIINTKEVQKKSVKVVLGMADLSNLCSRTFLK